MFNQVSKLAKNLQIWQCKKLKTFAILPSRKWICPVNQRVAGSSPAGGAKVDKPSEMMAFSFLSSLHSNYPM